MATTYYDIIKEHIEAGELKRKKLQGKGMDICQSCMKISPFDKMVISDSGAFCPECIERWNK